MKICHINIMNFRSLDNFDEEVGKHNIIVGKNNTGKSNLLWAIYYFYNPKNLSGDDFIIRQNDDEESEKKLQITLTFDNLTDIEKGLAAHLSADDDILILIRNGDLFQDIKKG